MDVSSLMRNSKNQKLNEEHDMDGSSNSLDNFPNAILRHILSSLPTKDAVATSVLSKRWWYLWTSIPNLEFHELLPTKRRLFMNFVERVLLLRDFSNVKKFSLMCSVLYDASRIDAWITTAVRRKVEHLYIYLNNFKEPFALPHCLFTCESLTALEIQMCYHLKLPPLICFSSLKMLTLSNVIFLDDYSTQQLFSGCPVLEELWLDECNWENLKVISIYAPRLRSLYINERTDTFNQSDSNGCQVMIFGMSLESLNYSGELINDYCLYNLTSLVEAVIYVFDWDHRPREVAYRVNKLLMGFSNVNDLELSSSTVKVLDYAEELFVHLPMFSSVTSLAFCSSSMDFDCRAFLSILQKLPCLESLLFLEGVSLSTSCVGDDWMLDPVPPCFLSHLKRIDVHRFDANERQLYVIKILLKNARVLDRMVLSCYGDFPWGLENRKRVHEQLLMLPRASTTCSIVWS